MNAVLPAPIVEEHQGFRVVRDDLLEGGTKVRAMLPMVSAIDEGEVVYASPAEGYAQVALALVAQQLGKRATVFTAKRKRLHPMTQRARAAGAKVVLVPNGYLNVVQSRAKEYAAKVGAYYMPFGVEDERAMQGVADAARQLNPAPAEVWSVAGSGVLTRSLQLAWPEATFHAVLVGKTAIDCGRACRHVHPLKFAQDSKVSLPFPSVRNYDAKGWEIMIQRGSPGALFWNVGA